VRMDSSAARVSSMSTTNMSLTCFQAASTSLGGIPGRLGTFRASRQVPTIWICEKWQIQRERKRPHTDVSDSAISECIISVKSVTDKTEKEKRGKDCAHTSQREKDCAPTKKMFKFGLLTHLGVATRLARRAFAIHTFEPSPNLVSKPRSPKSTREFPSPNPPTPDALKCRGKSDQVFKDSRANPRVRHLGLRI